MVEKVSPKIVALSFIESGTDILKIKRNIGIPESVKIMSKLETKESIDNLEEIVEHSDLLMIARGDLLHHAGEYDFCDTIEMILRVNNGRKPIYVGES